MGFYIETGSALNKVQALTDKYGAREVDYQDALDAFHLGKGVVVVIHNAPFDAAGFAFSLEELQSLAGLESESDKRVRQFMVMDRKLAEKLSGYEGE